MLLSYNCSNLRKSFTGFEQYIKVNEVLNYTYYKSVIMRVTLNQSIKELPRKIFWEAKSNTDIQSFFKL